jgi:hypothetical protein
MGVFTLDACFLCFRFVVIAASGRTLRMKSSPDRDPCHQSPAAGGGKQVAKRMTPGRTRHDRCRFERTVKRKASSACTAVTGARFLFIKGHVRFSGGSPAADAGRQHASTP